MTPVGRLAPKDQWDQTQLEQHLLAGPQFRWVDGFPNTDEPIILIIPGRYWHDRTGDITEALARYPRVTAFRVGDEEDLFDPAAVHHPDIHWWVQTPHPEREYPAGTRFIGVGWTPHFDQLPAEPPAKTLDLFLSGQNTHPRRAAAFAAARDAEFGAKIINETAGFTEGLPPEEYRDHMLAAKLAPCPSGAVSPDSFRVWEALQAHTVPIVDDISPVRPAAGFWNRLLPDAPFSVLVSWPKLHGVGAPILDDWPHAANQVIAWWTRQKHAWRSELVDQGPITVVVPVSPIPSHPGTGILDETIASVRHHLPDAPILVTFDGVRAEDVDRGPAYDEHVRRALWRLDHVHGNAHAIVFDQHKHQTGMMRAVLPDIATPLIMYVEHDTPIVTDEPIEFDAVTRFLLDGRSDLIRFHHEAVIPVEHEHMMHGRDAGHRTTDDGVHLDFCFLRTSQWSQRPHVATTAFYRRIIETCFTPDSRAFIEDRMHGIVDEAVRRDLIHGWHQYRLHIYDPGGGNMKRSYHTDGRAGSPKYDAAQVF